MRIRRITSTALAIALAAALTGCGDDGDDKAEKTRQPLTKEQVTSALITTDDIGEDFRVKDETDEDPDLGCLSEMTTIDDGFPGSTSSDEISIESTTEPNLPEVGNQISAFADEAAATKALDDFAASLGDCDAVEETKDGVTVALEVDHDDAKSTDEVDDQFNLDVTGTITAEGTQFPLSQRVRFMRIGNVITAIYFSSFETATSNDTENLAELAVAKILPVIDGGQVGDPDSLDLEPFTG